MFRPKKIEAEEKINALRTFQEQTTEKVRNYLSILNNYRYVTWGTKTQNLTEPVLLGSKHQGLNDFSVTIQGEKITSGREMKILRSFSDSKLSWEKNTNNIISKCRSLVFALRYLRRTLNLDDTIKVFKSHVIICLTYASPILSQLLNYSLRSKLRSFYFYVIRILVRDFEFKLNRVKLLRKSSLESIDDILFKRTSAFMFKLTYHLEPTILVGNVLSKACINERFPGRMIFFDTSSSWVGCPDQTRPEQTFDLTCWDFFDPKGKKLINFGFLGKIFQTQTIDGWPYRWALTRPELNLPAVNKRPTCLRPDPKRFFLTRRSKNWKIWHF